MPSYLIVQEADVTAQPTDRIHVCQCDADNPGVKNCTKGRVMAIKGGYWAGNPTPQRNYDQGDTEDSIRIIHNLSSSSGVGNYLSERLQEEALFAVSRCRNGLCLNTDWRLCVGAGCKSQGSGPLCGGCAGHSSLKLAQAVSV